MPFPALGSPAGRGLWEFALAELAACWLLFFFLIFANHLRVTRRRAQLGDDPGASLRAPVSMLGLAIEGLAFVVTWAFRRPLPEQTPAAWIILAMLLAPAALLLLGWAQRHLGQQWRIKAVVTAGHVLVTTGPYRVVRHPVLASMLLMLISNAVAVSRWDAAAGGLILYVLGTEIRVRAEDGLLARRFPDTFPPYRARVRAYIPFLR